MRRHVPALVLPVLLGGTLLSGASEPHPRLFFSGADLPALRARAAAPALQATSAQLLARARWLLTAPPIVPSLAKRGEPDPPGELKGIESARRLQGRVATLALAYHLHGDRAFLDAAVENLRRAVEDWRIWVDTAHAPPYDLMSGELALTLAIGYDWLHADLTPAQRAMLVGGAERLLTNYLAGVERKMFWFTAQHNWNPVCNGGAAVLALAMSDVSDRADRVLAVAVPAMAPYWAHLADDGGWDEGTGYWAYGHRYAFMAAEALQRAGRPGGADRLAAPGAARTGFFPMVFNPGRTLSASFGDSASRAEDPIFYLLARQYRQPAFAWFQDRVAVRDVQREGWPQEALALIWRPAGEPWMPEAEPAFAPAIDVPALFGSIGWGMLAPHLPDPPSFLAFKNGSLAANHTHLDLNTISVGRGEEMLLVDLGSRPYPADYFSPTARYGYYEITTRGHNTVLVGGRGQVLGRAGQLTSTALPTGVTALRGVADGAYEADTPRARRHAVHLPGDYYVVVDELAHAVPQTVELRFHTYAQITGSGRRFTFTGQQGALDVLLASAGSAASTESPGGWIRAVNVLRVVRPAASDHVVVTVLHPRALGDPPAADARVQDTPAGLFVTVGAQSVTFVRDEDGLRLAEAGVAHDPAVGPRALAQSSPASLHQRIDAAAAALEPKLVQWRRDFHQHPELSNREVRTAQVIAAHLRDLGLEVRTGIAKTGVVGILRGGTPGPVVALRADMDALPVTEEVDLPFRSTVTAEHNGQQVGVMHACGHDMHMAALMGAAEVLAALRPHVPGTVVFVFQPAEEGAPRGEEGGAEIMIREGVLDQPKVEAIFGLHVFPFETGSIMFRPEGMMASGDTVRIKVRGRQTHGALPWAGVDPVVVSAQIVLGLQTIVSRQSDITKAPAVVTIGMIHGGSRSNIIPDEVSLEGTIRTFDPDMRTAILERVRRTAEGIAQGAGATAEVSFTRGDPVTWNDRALTERMTPSLRRVATARFDPNVQVTTTAEDFSEYQRKVPGLFFFLGITPKGTDPATVAANHSPRFYADEAALVTGVRALASLAVDYAHASAAHP